MQQPTKYQEMLMVNHRIVLSLHGEFGNWQNGIGMLTLIAISRVVMAPAKNPPKNRLGLILSGCKLKYEFPFVLIELFWSKKFLFETFPSIYGNFLMTNGLANDINPLSRKSSKVGVFLIKFCFVEVNSGVKFPFGKICC